MERSHFFTKGISIIWLIATWLIGAIPFVNLINRKKHKIHINIDEKNLFIQWRPKKLVKDKSYHIDDIDQIYIKTVSGYNSIYMIVNGLEGQKHIKLIGTLKSLSKARYLEQEIERHLGIKDRIVPEETK